MTVDRVLELFMHATEEYFFERYLVGPPDLRSWTLLWRDRVQPQTATAETIGIELRFRELLASEEEDKY